jgi:serine protease Do
VDIKGRLIGMNVAIATGRETQGTSSEGQSAGISFAIPLGTIESVASQLITKGKVARGYLGISWPGMREPVIYESSIRQMGVRVSMVAPEGPAEKAGIKAGDIITSVEGQSVTAIETLRALVTSLSPGKTVKVEGYRSGKPQAFEVTLGEFPADTLAAGAVTGELFRYGMRLPNGLDRAASVWAVAPNSAAASAGFKEGQLILRVDDKPVSTVREVLAAAAEGGLLIGAPVVFSIADDKDDETTASKITVRIVR